VTKERAVRSASESLANDEADRVSPGPGSGEARRLDARVAERLADTMFALSTPSRVLILGCLLDGPHSVSELMDALGMEQSAVSHQLRVLRDHTLVKVERAGRQRLYALHDEHVAALLEEALRHVEQRGEGLQVLRQRSSVGKRRGTSS
jgi:DNA-binding transcriptional ArsR family regulator